MGGYDFFPFIFFFLFSFSRGLFLAFGASEMGRKAAVGMGMSGAVVDFYPGVSSVV